MSKYFIHCWGQLASNELLSFWHRAASSALSSRQRQYRSRAPQHACLSFMEGAAIPACSGHAGSHATCDRGSAYVGERCGLWFPHGGVAPQVHRLHRETHCESTRRRLTCPGLRLPMTKGCLMTTGTTTLITESRGWVCRSEPQQAMEVLLVGPWSQSSGTHNTHSQQTSLCRGSQEQPVPQAMGQSS